MGEDRSSSHEASCRATCRPAFAAGPALSIAPGRAVKALARLGVALAPLAAAAPAAAQDYAARLLRQPASQSVAGNQERFVILPSVVAAYEDNPLPYNFADRNSPSSLRISPGLDLIFNRRFGKTQVSVNGTAGYDFNTRYKFLNQPRINAGASVDQPVGGRCALDGRVFYQQVRYSQFDVSVSNDATSRTQVYDANFSCSRPVGFSPFVGVTYSRQTSDKFDLFDYTTFIYRGGVSYVKPSLGTISLSYSHQALRRPKIKKLIGIGDGTNVQQVSLSLSRAVAPRLSFNIGGGYYWADPERPGLPSSSGASYNGAVTYLPTTRLRISGGASRDITNEGGISSTYVRRDDFSLSAAYTISSRSVVTLSGQRTMRRFTGEDVANAVTPIGKDRVSQVGIGYSLDTLRRFRIGVGASHVWRDGRGDFYDYQANSVSVSIGARF